MASTVYQTGTDRWAGDMATWMLANWDKRFRDLPGWTAECGMGQNGWVVHELPLTAFTILGAQQEMPFEVYAALDAGNETTIQPLLSWMGDIKARRAAGIRALPPSPTATR